jgi:hypothetical protein
MAGLLSGLLDPTQAPGTDSGTAPDGSSSGNSPIDQRVVWTSLLDGLAQGLGQYQGISRLPVTPTQALAGASEGAVSGYNAGIGALYNSQLAQANVQGAQADTLAKRVDAAQKLTKFNFLNSILSGTGGGGMAPSMNGAQPQQVQQQAQPAPQMVPQQQGAPVQGMPQGQPMPVQAPPGPQAGMPPQQGPGPQQAAPTPPAQVTGQVQAPYSNQTVPIDRIRGILNGSIDTWNPSENEAALLAGSYAGVDVSHIQNRLKTIDDQFSKGMQVSTDPSGKPVISPVPGFNQTSQGTAQATALGTSLGTNQQSFDANGNIVPMAGSLQSKAASSVAGAAGTMAAQSQEGGITRANDAARIGEEKAARAATPVLVYNPATGQSGTINTAQGQTPPPGYQPVNQQTPLQAANIDANKAVITTAPEAIQGLRTDQANIQGLKQVVTDPAFTTGGFQSVLAPIRSLLSNQLGPANVANLTDQQLLDAYKGSVSLAVARSNIGQSGRLDQQEVKATADSVGSLGNTPYALRARAAALETLNNVNQTYTAGKLAAVNAGGDASAYDSAYFATNPKGIYTPADQAAFKIIAKPISPAAPTVTLPKFDSPQAFGSWFQTYSPYFDASQAAAVQAAANRAQFNGRLIGGAK